MSAIDRRLSKLENQFGIAHDIATYLVIVRDAGSELGSVEETHIQILNEAGFLRAGSFNVVDLSQIPAGLSAEETQRFVRENGARICVGSRGARDPGKRGMEGKEKPSAQCVAIKLVEA
jgi:hypothetical protein